MKIRSLFLLLTLVAGLAVAGAALAAEPPPEDLTRLVAAALANNPELKASAARWQLFSNKVAQARSLDDPMLMLKIQNGVVTDPLNFSREPMTAKVIGISQQLPFWGKRQLKGEVATLTADSYRWTVDERKLELTRMVKEAWYQIFFIDKSLGIVAKNLRVLDDFITLAETKYAVGQGVQQDILKAQVERSKLLDMQITLEQQRQSAAANLNTLLFRPADTPVGTITEALPAPVSQSAAELRQLAYGNRPLLKSLDAQVARGEAGLKLADKDFYPDFNVSLEYMQREPVMGNGGYDMYSLGVTFNLPLQRARRHAAVAEANSEITMASEEVQNLKNSINYGVADLLAQLERRRKLLELYKSGIIPQASQTLESATINYRVNKVDFLTLLDSLMSLFNYEREYYDSLADYGVKRAQLEALVGTELR
ncbi:RND transporter [Geotalea uraniireducens]|uniref:RND transporter n=1 Tax=Geotalea uraniireducens TaxID=351604 RepID=A0ABM8EK60_9BACT|nr:TolC family protein [Geotalea uraniireducens]BDV42881.1 RND transporter [Geotalea uraniireducens]